MRLHLVWLGAFCGSANANSLATDLTPSPVTWPDSLPASKDDVSIPRSLRTLTTANENDEGRSIISTADKGDEERGPFNVGLQEMWSRFGEPVQKIKSRASDFFESTITDQTWARWEKNQESLEYVLKMLVRAKAEGMYFNRWLGRANSLEANNVLSMLVRYYPAGDLYELLEAAKNEPFLKVLAEEVQQLQIVDWLARNEHPDDIFKVLKLSDRKLDDVMTSPNLPVWDTYFDRFKTNNRRSLITRVGVLRNLYNDEKNEAVFQVLVTTKTQDSVAGKLAAKWLDEQMDSWLKAEYRPRDVFGVVERGCRLENVLTSSKLPLWTEYLAAFNEIPGVDKTCAADVLLDTYIFDNAVFWMLEKAKEKPLTRALATEWQEQQIQNWSKKRYLYNSEDVFRVLKLNRELDGLLTHPFMKIWLNYMEETGQAQGTGMIDTISKCFPPSKLNESLEAAKYVPDTKELTTKLQTQQMMKWINNKRDGEYVFEKLHLHSDSASPSNLKVWKTYVASYIKPADPRGYATKIMGRYSKDYDLSNMLPAA